MPNNMPLSLSLHTADSPDNQSIRETLLTSPSSLHVQRPRLHFENTNLLEETLDSNSDDPSEIWPPPFQSQPQNLLSQSLPPSPRVSPPIPVVSRSTHRGEEPQGRTALGLLAPWSDEWAASQAASPAASFQAQRVPGFGAPPLRSRSTSMYEGFAQPAVTLGDHARDDDAAALQDVYSQDLRFRSQSFSARDSSGDVQMSDVASPRVWHDQPQAQQRNNPLDLGRLQLLPPRTHTHRVPALPAELLYTRRGSSSVSALSRSVTEALSEVSGLVSRKELPPLLSKRTEDRPRAVDSSDATPPLVAPRPIGWERRPRIAAEVAASIQHGSSEQPSTSSSASPAIQSQHATIELPAAEQPPPSPDRPTESLKIRINLKKLHAYKAGLGKKKGSAKARASQPWLLARRQYETDFERVLHPPYVPSPLNPAGRNRAEPLPSPVKGCWSSYDRPANLPHRRRACDCGDCTKCWTCEHISEAKGAWHWRYLNRHFRSPSPPQEK